MENVFETSLRVKKPRPLHTVLDIFQMRSNCTNWRTNPQFSFLFEGICKFMTLSIVTVLCWQQSPFTLTQVDANYNPVVFEKLSATLEAIVVASVLYEFGKLMSNKFKIRRYLKVSQALLFEHSDSVVYQLSFHSVFRKFGCSWMR